MDKAEFDLHADVEQRHWWFTGRRNIMQRLLREIVPPGEGKSVVDIGCGTGANIASLAGEYRAVGVDASPYAVEHARRAYPDVEFHATTDDAELARLVSAASAVTIMDVLEHVPDDHAMLSKLLAAARPGTHFLMTVPANLELWSKHDEVFGHYRRYTGEQFAAIWAGLDVECELLSFFNARLYSIVKMIRTRKRRREEATDSHESDLKIPMMPLNAMLHRIFAGEGGKLARALREHRQMPYQQGVSLIAIVRRGPGEIVPRTRPRDAVSDYFDPVRKEYLTPEEAAHA
jgi:2-polyprenyl-3-methyl-5-hydroxy-6-metoxy-1,4-benzoquinol methylase